MRELLRQLAEGQVAVSADYVARLRKDFLMLLGNVKRVATPEQLDVFRAGMLAFKAQIERLRVSSSEALKNLRARAQYQTFNQRLEADATYLLDHVRDLWALERDLSPPGSHREYYQQYAKDFHDPVARYLNDFRSEAKPWEARVRRVAPKAWKWIEDVARIIGQDAEASSLTVDTGGGTLREVAGFRVRLDGFAGEQTQVDGLHNLEAGLRELQKAARRRFPALLHRVPAIVMRFNISVGGGAAATWSPQHIEVLFWGMHGRPQEVAKLLAHEIAHGIWRQHLSAAAREAWQDFLVGDMAPLDLRQVLKDLGDESTFEPRIYRDDPAKFLQVTALNHDPAYNLENGAAIRRWLEGGGEPVIQVAAHPITAYAAKNPEEAFCEALSMAVVYGERAVYPEVQRALRAILPEVRMEEIAMRGLLRRLEEEKACHRTT